MSAFCGLVRWDHGPLDDRIGRALGGHPRQVTYQQSERAIACHRSGAPGNQSSRRAGLPSRTNSLFVAKARLDNTDEIGTALGLTAAERRQMSDEALLLRSLEAWGPMGLRRVLGAFAFAWWREEDGQLLLGRDRIGHVPLYVHRGNGFVAFATRLPALLAVPDVPRALDETALAHYLALNLESQRTTFYRGIDRVANCHALRLEKGRAEEIRYWEPDLTVSASGTARDMIAQARDLLDAAVANSLRGTSRAAISTSGGLDSAAIAATTARLGLCDRVTCFTLVPPDGVELLPGERQYADETSKVEALGRLYPDLDLRFVKPRGLHAFDENNATHFLRTGLPVLNPVNMGWFGALWDTVRDDGFSVLLDGRLGNQGLTWPGDFAYPELLRSGQILTLGRELYRRARRTGKPLATVFLHDVLRQMAPRRLADLWRQRPGAPPQGLPFYSALNPQAIDALNLNEAWQRTGFDPNAILLGRFAGSRCNGKAVRAYALFANNAPSREAGDLRSDQYGFESRSPLSDPRLLEFLLTVPETLFKHDGIERWFAREVLADRLPRDILDERRGGAQCPEWFHRLTLGRSQIAMDVERLEASPLASRLLDVPRLKQLVADWPADGTSASANPEDYRLVLGRGLHIGRFIRWVEGGNG